MKKAMNESNDPDRERQGFVEVLSSEVRRVRKANRLTQEDLSLMASVGRRFISELENGKRSVRLEEVIKVLTVLGLELVLTKTNGGR